MKREPKYVKLLQDMLGFQWDKSRYHVHHLNHNHNDNSIANLVLLPNRLHGRYHYLYNLVGAKMDEICDEQNLMSFIYNAPYIKEFIDVKYDIALIYQAHRDIYNLGMIDKNLNRSHFLLTHIGEIYKKYE